MWGPPDVSSILYTGPTVVHFYADSLLPTEFRWDFDPPFALPRRGHFAFFILQDPCVGSWDILASGNPPLYEGGNMWYTPRSSCRLLPSMQLNLADYPQYDVVFQIGFCRDMVTPAIRKRWGQLKILYR